MRKLFLTLFIAITSIFTYADKKEYQGTVVPLLTCVYKAGTNFPFMGEVANIPRVGQIVEPPVYNKNGELVKEGDILIGSDLSYQMANFLAAKDAFESSKVDLVTEKEQYKRYDNLSKSGSVSKRDFDNALAGYLGSKGVYEKDQGDYLKSKAVLEAMTQHATFPAIVNDVYRPVGVMMNEHEVVSLSQLSPIGIEISIPKGSVTPESAVTVYPMHSNKAMGVVHGWGFSADKGKYTFLIDNFRAYGSHITKGSKKLPIISEMSTIVPFDLIAGSGLGINTDSIFKDSNGQYVWKAEGVKNMQKGKGIDQTFKIKKVYIKPEDKFRNYAGYSKSRLVADNPDLSQFDMVISRYVPKDLKDGDEVCYMKNDYIFMPGDKVKVVIGE